MESEQTIWQVSAVIEATEEQARAAVDAIERALCPDEDHEGPCSTPWTTLIVRFEDLEPEVQASWQESFDEDRRPAP